MIPYDDLVIALATWRAKQGLPVAQMSAQFTPPAVTTPPAAAPQKPPSGPTRAPPPARQVAQTIDDPLDVDDAALLDEQAEYDDVEGAFSSAMADNGDESTSIGNAPQAPAYADQTLDEPTRGGKKKKSDW